MPATSINEFLLEAIVFKRLRDHGASLLPGPEIQTRGHFDSSIFNDTIKLGLLLSVVWSQLSIESLQTHGDAFLVDSQVLFARVLVQSVHIEGVLIVVSGAWGGSLLSDAWSRYLGHDIARRPILNNHLRTGSKVRPSSILR